MLKAIFWWFWSLKSKTVIYQWSRQWIVTNTRTELANNMGGRYNTNWGTYIYGREQTRHHPIHCNGLSNIHSLSEVVRWWCVEQWAGPLGGGRWYISYILTDTIPGMSKFSGSRPVLFTIRTGVIQWPGWLCMSISNIANLSLVTWNIFC